MQGLHRHCSQLDFPFWLFESLLDSLEVCNKADCETPKKVCLDSLSIKLFSCLKVKIAVVGDGTSQVIRKANSPELLQIAFTPSKVG